MNSKTFVSEEAVLNVCFCLKFRMWRIPLQPNIINKNTDTILLDGPKGTESLNRTYTVTNIARILQHIKTNCYDLPSPDEAINNV